MTTLSGWYGVDLDGTLAEYDYWKGIEHIGNPIPAMVNLVKQWITEGKDVRIFTARVTEGIGAVAFIEKWCEEHIGKILPVTNVKDFNMIELWDDRVIQVEENTGKIVAKEAYLKGHYHGRYNQPAQF